MQEEKKRKNILITFVKNPVLGEVKTRLATTVGDTRALAIYKELSKYTLSQARELPVEKRVYYSHYIEEQDMWQEAGFIPFLQEGEDLGERMSNAFQQGLESGNSVVLIGTDCPKITTALLQTAFDALLNNDVVLGPAEDGGYYLIAKNKMIPELFQDMAWSTSSVCQDTIHKSKDIAGINPSILMTLPDVDKEEDWQKYGWIF